VRVGGEEAEQAVRLAEKPKPRRNETREILVPVRARLNSILGVRVARNNVGVLEWAPGKKLRYGLGHGSADLVGIVTVSVWFVAGAIWTVSTFGRAFALEVKRPGVKPKPEQVAWLAAFRRLGGFAAVVHSVEEGIAAVERCRKGLSE
jgi:hypothetical protein